MSKAISRFFLQIAWIGNDVSVLGEVFIFF